MDHVGTLPQAPPEDDEELELLLELEELLELDDELLELDDELLELLLLELEELLLELDEDEEEPPLQLPRSVQALDAAQPSPGVYGPPIVHQPPTVH